MPYTGLGRLLGGEASCIPPVSEPMLTHLSCLLLSSAKGRALCTGSLSTSLMLHYHPWQVLLPFK
jgi:hypothetical protein